MESSWQLFFFIEERHFNNAAGEISPASICECGELMRVNTSHNHINYHHHYYYWHPKEC